MSGLRVRHGEPACPAIGSGTSCASARSSRCSRSRAAAAQLASRSDHTASRRTRSRRTCSRSADDDGPRARGQLSDAGRRELVRGFVRTGEPQRPCEAAISAGPGDGSWTDADRRKLERADYLSTIDGDRATVTVRVADVSLRYRLSLRDDRWLIDAMGG